MRPAGLSIGFVKGIVPCLPLKRTGRPLNLNIINEDTLDIKQDKRKQLMSGDLRGGMLY